MTRSGRALKAMFLLAALLGVTLALAVPRPVNACSIYERCGSEVYYFSDASHSEMVGYRGWECNPCTGTYWGEITNYYEWYPQPCCY